MEVRKLPTWLRVLQFVTGGIAIALSGYVLFNPITTSLFFLVFLGISLISVGISTIIEGISFRRMSKTSRVCNVIIGIAAITGGLIALTQPIMVLVSLIWFVMMFVFIYGAGLVATGISRHDQSKESRITSTVLGGIVLAFSGLLLAFPGLTLPLMITLLSLSLFMNGMERIISGAIGKIIVIREQSPTRSTSAKTKFDQAPKTESEVSKDSKAEGEKK